MATPTAQTGTQRLRVEVLSEIDSSTRKVVAQFGSSQDAYAALAEGRLGDGPFTVASILRRDITLVEPKRIPKRVLNVGLSYSKGRPRKTDEEKAASKAGKAGKDPKTQSKGK